MESSEEAGLGVLGFSLPIHKTWSLPNRVELELMGRSKSRRFLLNESGTFQKFPLPEDGICYFQNLGVLGQEKDLALGSIIMVGRCCQVMQPFN